MHSDTTFSLACDWLFSPDIEGREYHETPGDRGGGTKFGISSRTYPDLDIRNLTEADALALLYQDFWLAYRCDELTPPLGMALFGGLVNSKPLPIISLFQRTVGVRTDGIIGPITIGAANQSPTGKTLIQYLSRRALHYHHIVLADSTQAQFFRGWMKRIFSLQSAIHRHFGESL